MILIEKNNQYKFRLMPNFYSPANPVLEHITDFNGRKFSKFFCYVLTPNNKIDYVVFGKQIFNYLNKIHSGFYGTSEGYFISEDELKYYYANEDKSIIYEGDSPELSVKKYTDVIYYDRRNLFDIKTPYFLEFKTRDKHGYLETYNIKFGIDVPLYKDGDDKNKITDLYAGVPTLDHCITNYKNDLLRHTRLKKLNQLFINN